MDEQAYEKQEDNMGNESSVEVTARELNAEQLSKLIGMVESLSDHIMEVESNFEPSLTVRCMNKNAVRCYEEMHEVKKCIKKIFVPKEEDI